jgi:hypothetical protein
LPAVRTLDLHTTKEGEEATRPCSESEMGHGRWHVKESDKRAALVDCALDAEVRAERSVRARLARRVAEKAAQVIRVGV